MKEEIHDLVIHSSISFRFLLLFVLLSSTFFSLAHAIVIANSLFLTFRFQYVTHFDACVKKKIKSSLWNFFIARWWVVWGWNKKTERYQGNFLCENQFDLHLMCWLLISSWFEDSLGIWLYYGALLNTKLYSQKLENEIRSL